MCVTFEYLILTIGDYWVILNITYPQTTFYIIYIRIRYWQGASYKYVWRKRQRPSERAPAQPYSSKTRIYLFAQLNCKIKLQIVRNWNVNMLFMDGRFFNCINLKTIHEAIKKSSIHEKKNYLVRYTFFSWT